MVALTSIPAPTPGYYAEEMDEEAVLYSRTRKKAIYLNETARVIWQLCDGSRSVGDIATILTGEFPDAAAQIERDVVDTVERLAGESAVSLNAKSAMAAPTQH